MRGVFLAGLIMAATALGQTATAAEQYVKVPQVVVRFEGPAASLRLLVVNLNVAVASPQGAANVRADRERIQEALHRALSSLSYDDYATSNLASRVKSIGRSALRRAKLDYIGDVLVQDVRLM